MLHFVGRSQGYSSTNGRGSEWNDNADSGDTPWGSSGGGDRPRGRGRGNVYYYDA